MKLEESLGQLGIEKDKFGDLHISRMFSLFVAVSERKVIAMTEPFLKYCPLASFLYRDLEEKFDSGAAKGAIKKSGRKENLKIF